MQTQETFGSNWLNFVSLRNRRLLAAVSILALVLGAFGIVRRLSPDKKLLLFDLGVGSVVMTVGGLAARRMIQVEAQQRRNPLASLLIGVTSAAASQGVLAMTLAGEPAGLDRVAALVGIQMLGAVFGGILGFLLGFFALAPVVAAGRMTERPVSRRDGLFVGVVVGLVGGWIIADMPNLGRWFTVTSAVVCGLGGFRAVGVFDQALQRRRRA